MGDQGICLFQFLQFNLRGVGSAHAAFGSHQESEILYVRPLSDAFF